MSSTENTPSIQCVAILFSGGPAPGANAVISAAAISFINQGIRVIGIKHGYSSLMSFSPERTLEEGQDYVVFDRHKLRRTRNSRGIIIGTARANPGKLITTEADLDDSKKVKPLLTVHRALRSLNVDALISIGGDDTLTTANKFVTCQRNHLQEDEKLIRVVHVPKTIDNDYEGIDFTFGYFTAVDFLATEIQNLLYDAESANGYFVAESMGRRAGWLAYGAAVAGEASLVFGVEDLMHRPKYLQKDVEEIDPNTGEKIVRDVMNVENVVNRILRTIYAREEHGKHFGVIVLAEGLAEYLPMSYLEGVTRDEHNHINFSNLNLCEIFTDLIADAYKKEKGRKKKVVGIQIGYECRCAKPHAFDVILGSHLGAGAFRVFQETQETGAMVTARNQLEFHYRPFEELIDPQTMRPRVRFIEPGSDFHKLARMLETAVEEE
ncbi:Pyrophosphate-dependent phosphofructokinase [Planctomycetales bacterium 10988]|nr:Pyrophosphate-dependent phosphofructokinase [Planctomycetales bacterium 10988]